MKIKVEFNMYIDSIGLRFEDIEKKVIQILDGGGNMYNTSLGNIRLVAVDLDKN